MTTDGLLLDTCFMLWLSNSEPVARGAVEKLIEVRRSGGLIAVSAMSAWEIGMLVSKGRLPYLRSPLEWFEQFASRGSVSVEPVSPEVLIDSSFLPGHVHNDPADRIIIATARARDLAVVTRDRAILNYGAAGFVKTIEC